MKFVKNFLGYVKDPMGYQDVLLDVEIGKYSIVVLWAHKIPDNPLYPWGAPWFFTNSMDDELQEFYNGAMKSFSILGIQVDILDTSVWSKNKELEIYLSEAHKSDVEEYLDNLYSGMDFEVAVNKFMAKYK